MIDINQSHWELIEAIKAFAAEELEFRQVAQRLRKLFHEPQRAYNDLAQLNGQNTEESTRIERYLEIATQARRARVEYETHMMLFEARRSLKNRP